MSAGPSRPPVDRPNAERTNGGGYLLTAEDLAGRWQVPTSQVYRLTREGLLPVVKLGRYYRYRLAAIETFEEAAWHRMTKPLRSRSASRLTPSVSPTMSRGGWESCR